jgi:hypothetical protein
MSEIYRLFSKSWEQCLDYSEESLIEMYQSESYGTPVKSTNGFLVGKRWLSVNVAMWKEDIELGLFRKSELYNDPYFPHWWLDSIFK